MLVHIIWQWTQLEIHFHQAGCNNKGKCNFMERRELELLQLTLMPRFIASDFIVAINIHGIYDD